MKALIKPIGFVVGLIAAIFVILYFSHWAFEGLANFID